jgi:uncharacterized membrane protein
VGEVLGLAWDRVKADLGTLVLVTFISIVVSAIPTGIMETLNAGGIVRKQTLEYALISLPLSLVGWIFATYLQAGLIQIWIAAAHGKTANFGDLFSGRGFLPLLGANLLTGLAVGVGMLFCLVPGIILALGFWMAPYFVVDAEMGPIRAMEASWQATGGHKGTLFLFFIASFFVALAGILACGVGVLVASPVISVGMAIIYTRLTGQTGGAASYAQPV